MERPRDDSPSGLSDYAEGDGLLGTGLTVSFFPSPTLPLGLCRTDLDRVRRIDPAYRGVRAKGHVNSRTLDRTGPKSPAALPPCHDRYPPRAAPADGTAQGLFLDPDDSDRPCALEAVDLRNPVPRYLVAPGRPPRQPAGGFQLLLSVPRLPGLAPRR